MPTYGSCFSFCLSKLLKRVTVCNESGQFLPHECCKVDENDYQDYIVVKL